VKHFTPNDTVALSEARIGVVMRRRDGSVHVTTVDAAEYALVADYRWYVLIGNSGVVYALASPPRECTVGMHRLILGVTDPKVEVDHIDHNGLNNTRANLRVCTKTENLRNSRRRRDNTSGFKGVCWNKRDQHWRALIYIAGKQRYLGVFHTPEEAAQAYNNAAVIHFGEFAHLNEGI